MSRYISLFILMIIPFFALGQSFALSETHPKTLVVTKVYRNILSVANNHQLGNLPSIEVIQRKKNTAAYAPKSNTIKIEETAYDLCAKLGKNRDAALGILIAHEFTHFSKKHQGINGFTCDYYDHTTALTHSSMEEEADFWGLFTSYLAGYNVLEVAPNLLKNIYQHYGFTQNMTGYPPLKVRQQLGNIAIQKLEEYIQLYEAGNYLTAIGAYEQSASCYATILKEYQSPELHNNLAVSLIRQALTVAPKGDYPFIYPIELDIESRLYRHQAPPFGFDPKRLVSSYLQKAVLQLESALQLNPNYTSAKLNLAVAQEMLGQITLAKNIVVEVNMLQLNPIQQTHWYILKGIIAAKENRLENSFQNFQQANPHPIARLNKQVLEQQPINSSPAIKSPIPAVVELDRIGDLRRINDFRKTIPLNTQSSSDYYQPKYQFQYNLLPTSSIWKISRQRKLEQYILQITSNPIAFTAEGLYVGSPISAIHDALGKEGILTSTASGQFLYYSDKGLIFLLDETNSINQWGKVSIVGRGF